MSDEQTSYVVSTILITVLIGVICGLLPFFVARKRRHPGLAWGGFITSVVGSAFLGIVLALPFAIIFTGISMATKPGTNLPEQPKNWR